MRVQLIVAAACLSAALTACGSSGGGSATPGQANPGGPADSGSGGDANGKPSPCGSTEPGLCTTITITGAVSLQGTFQAGMSGGDRIIDTCADYAKGDQGKARLALPISLGTKVGDHTVSIANRVSRYKGQGTYERKDLGAIDGGLHVDIDGKSYQIKDASTATAEIAADGSGKLTFTDLRESTNSSDTSPKGIISGNYSWTCHD